VCLGRWSGEKVKKLYAEGLLHLSDYYWRAGMKEWAPLQTLLKPLPKPLPKQSVFSKGI
jgi:hypothetical protein